VPRILGVDIPKEKRIDISLTYIYGIGRTLAKRILTTAQIDGQRRAKELTDEEVHKLADIIPQICAVEGDVRRDIAQNIKRLISIGSYRGSRHRKNLPCRGQRSHTNARTRKGPRQVVGGMRKKVTK